MSFLLKNKVKQAPIFVALELRYDIIKRDTHARGREQRGANVNRSSLSNAKQVRVALVLKLERIGQIARLFDVNGSDLTYINIVWHFDLEAVVIVLEVWRLVDHVFNDDLNLDSLNNIRVKIDIDSYVEQLFKSAYLGSISEVEIANTHVDQVLAFHFIVEAAIHSHLARVLVQMKGQSCRDETLVDRVHEPILVRVGGAYTHYQRVYGRVLKQ